MCPLAPINIKSLLLILCVMPFTLPSYRVWTGLTQDPGGGLGDMSSLTYKPNRCCSVLGWTKRMNSQLSLAGSVTWAPGDSQLLTVDTVGGNGTLSVQGEGPPHPLFQEGACQNSLLPTRSPRTPSFSKPYHLDQRLRYQVQFLTLFPVSPCFLDHKWGSNDEGSHLTSHTVAARREPTWEPAQSHAPLLQGLGRSDHSQCGLGLLYCPLEYVLCSLDTRETIISPNMVLFFSLFFIFFPWWKHHHILTEHFLLFLVWQGA